MASTQTALVQGTCLRSETRSGVARATGNEYTIRTALVLVDDSGVVELRYPNNLSHLQPERGDTIDPVVVEFSVYNGDVQATVVSRASSLIGV
jgi:hypothetical protein